MPPTSYYTVSETAEELGVTPRSVYIWLWDGSLKATQPRRSWRISSRNLAAFKRRRLRASPGPKPAWVRALAAKAAT